MSSFHSNAAAASLLAAAFLSACSSAPVKPEPKPDIAAEYERVKRQVLKSDVIAPGFTVKIEHSADSKIAGEYEVDFYGMVKLPYKVTVRAAGVTPEQLAGRVRSAYRGFFKGKSNVTVDITKREFLVEVRGGVQKPGRYSVRLDTSLEELVAEAGGFLGSGSAAQPAVSSAESPQFLRIERPDFKTEKSRPSINWFQLAEYFNHYGIDPEFIWRGGEKIFFQQTAPADANIKSKWHTVTVMGEVRDPKEHPVLPNADLLTYITRSGGPTGQADLSSVEIIRRVDDDVEEINLSGGRSYNNLKAGDIVLVRAIDNSPSVFEKALTYLQVMTGVATSVLLVLLL